MLRELIAPAQEQVAFREYESPPLRANEIRVKSQFGAANTVQRWHHIKVMQAHAVATIQNIKSFEKMAPGWCTILQDLVTCVLAR